MNNNMTVFVSFTPPSPPLPHQREIITHVLNIQPTSHPSKQSHTEDHVPNHADAFFGAVISSKACRLIYLVKKQWYTHV